MNSRTLQSDSPKSNQIGVDYVRLFQDLPDPYLLIEATDSKFTVIDINKAREAAVSGSRDDYIGRSLFDTYPYTDERFKSTAGKNIREHLQQVVRTGRSYRLEPFGQPLTDSDGKKYVAYLQGSYTPLRDVSGRVRYILASIHEVTEELHAMERVATAESRLAAALTIGKVGSWVFDVASQRIIGDANFRKLFKMNEAKANKFDLKMFFDSVHKDDRSRIVSAVMKSLKVMTPFEEECRVVLADGSQRWILARGKLENYEGQQLFSGVVVDLTEQRKLRAQVELARQQDRLNRRAARILQQRNEELEAISRSKDEFVALASHQLRTPATAVKQYIGMVLQGYVGDINGEQADVLTKAFESNERQIQIINQILSAARADTGRLVMMPMPVDLCSLTQGIVVDMDETLRQRQHTIALNVPKGMVRVSADLGYIRMAIENVLHNASVYTPRGGSITVTLSRKSKRCILSISDTGVGIKKADLGKLFVKFSRIHNPLSVEAGGSGIGLYLTAEIIRLHGGTIDVESRVGKGSTFAISLPLMQNTNSTAESAA